MALSADNELAAKDTVDKLSLDFTVLYGLDPDAASQSIGCYTGVHEGLPHLQPAGFVLRPDGTVAHAVYSSGKVGRLTAADALTIVKDLRKQHAAGARAPAGSPRR